MAAELADQLTVARRLTVVLALDPASRSRGGWTDGRDGQSWHRPKSWWLDGRPPWTVAAWAEVVVVGRTAAMANRGTGRGRGGCADGRDGQSHHKLKSWWSYGWRARRSAAGRLAVTLEPPQPAEVVVAQAAVIGSSGIGRSRGDLTVGGRLVSRSARPSPPSRSRGGWADGRDGQSGHWPKSWWLSGWQPCRRRHRRSARSRPRA